MRPSDVPTYVEAGAADLGHHRQGRAASSSPSATSTSWSTSATAAARWCSRPWLARTPPPRPSAPGRRPDRDQIPADRHPLLPRDRPPGRDRRGQGLGRARAADRAGRGDRRPHRERGDAKRERARGPRGDRVRARRRLIANPVAHKLKAPADRCATGAAPCDVSALPLSGDPADTARALESCPGARSRSATRSPRSSREVRSHGDDGPTRLHTAVRHRRRGAEAAPGRGPMSSRRPRPRSIHRSATACERAIENVETVDGGLAGGPGRVGAARGENRVVLRHTPVSTRRAYTSRRDGLRTRARS